MNRLQKFIENCSDSSLGDLMLAKSNRSVNTRADFREHVQALLRQTQRLVDFADAWAQAEAESRYVNLVREAAKQRNNQLSVESVTRSKQ